MKKFDVIFPKDFLITVQQNEEDWKWMTQPGFLATMRMFYPPEKALKNFEEPEKIKSESESNLKETKTK